MSGHSKWSTIKRQKGVSDIKRGQLFTKITRAITMAVRDGGGSVDSASNFKLRIAIEKAKEVNMPKDNIQRAIDRGARTGPGGALYESVVYEGYGPFGVAFIIESATDNKQRTGAQVKHILERAGGSLAGSGSVSFLFDQQGLVVIEKDSYTEEQVLEKAIDAGALDMQSFEGGFEIYTPRDTLHTVKESLEKNGMNIGSSELIYRPKTTIPIVDTSQARSIASTIDALEELDDIQRVFTNEDIVAEVTSILS